MELKDVSPGDGLWEEVWSLYESSFPDRERRSIGAQLRAMSDSAFRTRAVLDGEEGFVGLLFYWTAGDFIYIEHFAVRPRLRGSGVGSRVLKDFIEAAHGRRIILEADPPEDEISIRRIGFYRRLGFEPNSCKYIHPSYRSGAEAEPHRLVLMSFPARMTCEDVGSFTKYIAERVLACTD